MSVDTEQSEVPSAESRGRRAMFWTGVALMAVGVVLVGYFAWQFFGTNIVAHHKQQTLVKELRKDWISGSGPTAETGSIEAGDPSALVRIPRFGKDYVMPVLEGTTDVVLAKGFGHFADSADPGRTGNYALAAHRITHGEPLRHLPELGPGDKVIVETRQATYTYVLDTNPNQLIVPFTAGWVIKSFPVNPNGGVQPDPANGSKLITLTTCSELFHTDNRMIAFGHLQSSERK